MKDYYTTAEAAKILGVSRITVFQRIKAGKLEAKQFGRNYSIPAAALPFGDDKLETEKNDDLREAVKRVVREYGTTLKKLGAE
jgi:excisionase family DNA binding protein